MGKIAACLSAALLAAWAGAIELQEPAAGEEDWGYRPAEGFVADRNPPAFTWFPSDGAAAFTLEVASDVAFEAVVYRVERTPWSNHCPATPLKPGAYHWRYAALDDAGARSPWSAVRSFTVPAGAAVFPQPTIAELVERMPAEHPRLFMRPEELPAIRAAAAGSHSAAWAAALAKADKLLGEKPDMSEPPLYPEGTERLSEPWKEIWWGNRLRTIAVTDGAATLALAWRVTGEEKYAAASKELLMAMAAWDPKGSTQYNYNDEAAMPILYYASRAYDWLHPYLNDDERKAVIDVMRVRGGDCYAHLRARKHLWRPYASHSNRAWHKLGELAIAFHGDIPEAETWLDFANTLFYTAYPVWGDSDGGWHEGTGYWHSYLYRFMNWAFIIKPAFGIDAFDRPFFHQTGDFALYTMPPGSRHSGFGDMAERSTPARVAPLMAVLAAGADNPHWQWYADEAGGKLDNFFFAYRASGGAGKAPADLPTSKAFRGVGIAALNSDLVDGTNNVQVLFKSSPMGRISHGYNANNAFHVNVHGKPMFVNTGSRDVHGSPHHTKWMWGTRSQNAILVNGAEQVGNRAASVGRITAFETSAEVDVVAGEAGASYENLDRWSRRIVFLKPGVIVVHDVLDAPEPSAFQWLLHAPGQFAIDGAAASYTDEGDTLTAHFVLPKGLALSQKDGYDPPPHAWANFKIAEWHLAAEAAEKAAHREFLTVLAVNDADASWEVAEEGDTVRLAVRFADGTEAALRFNDLSFAVTRGAVDWSFTD